MDNLNFIIKIAFTSILIALVIIWFIGNYYDNIFKYRSKFKQGLEYGQSVFQQNTFIDAYKELTNFVEHSQSTENYSDYDIGIEQSIKQAIYSECEILNNTVGGDWSFCEKTATFNDYLTNRIIL